MGDVDLWRWLWVVVLAAFLLGEMFTPGTFFFLPFAVGALLAAIAAFIGFSVGLQWVFFIGGAVVSSLAFIPLRRRLDKVAPPMGVGAHRILHQRGVVIEAIPAGQQNHGTVVIEREQWRAHSRTGVAMAEGSDVIVVEVRGTGVIVDAIDMEGRQ